jgi:FkbM family methyltransferase
MKSSKLHQFTVWHDNTEEYHHLKREVFGQHSYFFETDSPTPFIIDAGAHIGLATLYFKKQYPHAKVIAIEPNPETFALLEKNVWENQLDEVEVFQCALADSNYSSMPFYLDETPVKWWSTAGFMPGAWTGEQLSKEISVSTKTLDSFITQPADYLKLDIEGIEQSVLEASTKLNMVRQISCEFHPHQGQSLPKLLEYLEQFFTIQVLKNGVKANLSKVTGLVQIEGVNKALPTT